MSGIPQDPPEVPMRSKMLVVTATGAQYDKLDVDEVRCFECVGV